MTTQKPLNLKNDVGRAKQVLAISVKELKGHFQLWNGLTAALKMVQAFDRDYESISYEAKMAFSKAIIVEYAKPWSGNKSRFLKALLDEENDIRCLRKITQGSQTHNALIELRDKMIAHVDHGYDSFSVSLRGVTIVNGDDIHPRQEGTIEHVFVPISIVTEASRGIWWINDRNSIMKICSHIEACLAATQASISKLAEKFREECFKHIHVLDRLNDLFEIRELGKDRNGSSLQRNYEFQHSVDVGEPFSLSNPKEIEFGDSNLNCLVGRYESVPKTPLSIDIKGRGFRLVLKTSIEKGLQWNVSFPKYPAPAENTK